MEQTYWLIKFPWTNEYNEYLSATSLESIHQVIAQRISRNKKGECILDAINAAPCQKQRKAFKFTDRHDAYLISTEINKSIKNLSKTISSDLMQALAILKLNCVVVRVYPKKKVEKSK